MKSATKSGVKSAATAAPAASGWHNEELIGNGITYKSQSGKEYISIAFDQPYTNAQGKQVPGVNIMALAAELNSGKRLSLQPLNTPVQLKNGGVRTHVIALRSK